MYMSLSAEDFKRRYNLGNDYKIEGMLAVGAWAPFGKLNLAHIESVLNELGKDFSYKLFQAPDLHDVHEFTIEGRKFWYFAAMGTAVMHMYIHRGSMLGSKKNILIGSVGGLAENSAPGDLICPTLVLGNDNARYYQRNNTDNLYRPNTQLAESLKARLPSDVEVHSGKTVTCEMIMGETREDIENWKKAGYLGIEMEAALVFSMSSYFNIPSAALLNIGDNLIKNITFFSKEHIDMDEVREHSRRITIKAALEELLAN